MAPVSRHLLEALQSIFPKYETVPASFYNLLGKALGNSAASTSLIKQPSSFVSVSYCVFLICHSLAQLRSGKLHKHHLISSFCSSGTSPVQSTAGLSMRTPRCNLEGSVWVFSAWTKLLSCPETAQVDRRGDNKQDLLGSLQVNGAIWAQLVYFRLNSRRLAFEFLLLFYTLLQKSEEGICSLNFFPLYFSVVHSLPLYQR